ncbi:alpha-galactosidase [Aureococcus anophagefferens]|nr:alpha-galactosidase [Aureococcus anophagefferens]
MHVPRLLCLVAVARGEFDTPMLGFNTCNVGCGNATFPTPPGCCARTPRRQRLAAGYTSVNLDEGWADLARDGDGNQVANEDRFPGGVRPVADALHARDLELGIYTSLSPETCGGKSAGSCGREARDGAAYVAWGVDYVKDDGCGSCHDYDAADWALESYRRMQAALRGAAAAAGRETPVFFSTESAPNVTRMSERPDLYGNTWRSGHDAIPTWGSVGQGEFGNNRVEEIRSHVTMHAMLKSTLLVSTEVDRLSDGVVALLTNRELLAVHQDPLGAAARRAASEPPARPRAVFGNASDYALFAVMPCEPGNPRQRWSSAATGRSRRRTRRARPGSSGPYPRGRYVGANPMGNDADGARRRPATDAWYWGAGGPQVVARVGRARRRRHPGRPRRHRPRDARADYCAEAVLSSGNLETWVAPLAGGRYAVALLNRSPAAEELTATWRALGLRGTYAVRDVWAGRDAGDFAGSYAATVPGKGVALLVLAPRH